MANCDKQHEEAKIEHYDLIVDGTGLVESIVACAASRSGKSVLHLDSNDYYGCNSASFPLQDFLSWCRVAITKKRKTAVVENSSDEAGVCIAKKYADHEPSKSDIVYTDKSLPTSINTPESRDDIEIAFSSSSLCQQTLNLNSSKSRLRIIHFQDIGNL